VDIHSTNPFIRLRVGIYDSFWEIPVEMVSDAPLENLTDLVKKENERKAQISQNPEGEPINYIFVEDYLISQNQTYLENL
ncbi:MAG: hypothetical protein AAB336_02720, partial [Acidobacteriota bacterium]